MNLKLISVSVLSAALVATSMPTATPAVAQTPVPPTATPSKLIKVPLPTLTQSLGTLVKTPKPLQFLAAPKIGKPTVNFENMSDYTHDSGLFSIQIPSAWKLNDISTKSDLHVLFVDPGLSALFLVRITRNDETLGTDGLGELLTSYLEGQFGKEKQYQPGDPEEVGDGVVAARFAFDGNFGGKVRSMVGDGFALQSGTLASTIVFLSDAAIYDEIRDQAYEVLGSYKLNPDALNTSTPTNNGEFALDELETYTHPSGAFEMSAPTGWQKVENDSEGSLLTGWVEPGGRGEVVAELVKVDKSFSKEQLRQLVQTYAKNVYGKKDAFKADKAKASSNTVSSVIFNFRQDFQEETLTMVGIAYVLKSGDNVAFLRMYLPRGEVEAYGDKLDEIVNSFRVDPNANFLK